MTTSSLYLAVDVGASRTAAAIARIGPDGVIAATPFLLGRYTDSVPSAIFVGDGELLFGEAAVRRGIAQPERLIREFKRRVGDGTPIRVGDRRFTPEQLFALFVSWVVDAVTEREGERPASLAASIPATWGDHRSGLVASALERSGWHSVRLISEPEAAAIHYAAARSLDPGSLLAVYDLGGGTFDTALVRVEDDAELHVEGDPVGLDAFGGADFDDLVLRHAIHAAGLSSDELVADDDSRSALAALRREVVEAKEALSFDAETVIPVSIGGGRTTVRLTRSEFEGMIEDGVTRTVDLLAELLDSAGVDPEELDAVLLTGGSSRIPRIAQLISERFDRSVAVDADPKAVISLGAVRAIAEDERLVDVLMEQLLAPDREQVDDPPAGDDRPPEFTRAEPHRRWLGRAATIAAVAGGALVLAAGITVAMLSLGDSSRGADLPPRVAPTTDAPSSSVAPWSTGGPLLTPAPPGVVLDIFSPPADGDPASQPADGRRAPR